MQDHEHDWRAKEKDPLIFEDGAAIIIEKCYWVEVLDSFESERWDEVFYEEGDECGETRQTRYEPTKIQIHNNIVDDIEIREQDFEVFDNLVQKAIESVENAEQNLKVVDLYPPDHPTPVVTVEVGEFTVTYEP